MKWSDIYKKYPNKFILIKNYNEKRLGKYKFKVTEAEVVNIFDNYKEMIQSYRNQKNSGINVLYSLPGHKDLIIEESPSLSFWR